MGKEEISEGGSTVAKDSVCDITPRDVSNAYCAVAEIFLTDAWFVPVLQSLVIALDIFSIDIYMMSMV